MRRVQEENFEPPTLNRRAFLRACALTVSAFAVGARALAQSPTEAANELSQLETKWRARLGVFAHDTHNGTQIEHRADERFPLCSTFKVIAAAAVLQRSARVSGLLQRRIRYDKSNLVTYSPITEKHVGEGMTVAELCAAALQYSDNTAGNLLIRLLGGPAVVTAFARSIGDGEFQLDRWETRLNSAIPGDPRDTTTPAAMGHSLEALALGTALQKPQREQLNQWMRDNTTGAKRIRAGVPADWIVGDKTGSGEYGTANDIAVIVSPARQPIVLAIYSTHQNADAKWNDEMIAAAARIVVKSFGVA